MEELPRKTITTSSISSSPITPTPTMEALPPEVVTIILSMSFSSSSLEELKAVGRCRCVCKLWNSILNDPTLTQLSKPTPDILIYYMDSEDEMFYVEDNSEALAMHPHSPHLTKRVHFPRHSSQELACTYIGTCNGLACLLRVGSKGKHSIGLPDNPIYILNPITGHHFQLPPYTVSVKRTKTWCCGFGFDDSRGQYKFVLIAVAYHSRTKSEVLVHTLGSNDWRKKLCTLPAYVGRCNDFSKAFVNGSFHWYANQRKGPIVSFNLVDEEFGFVQTPNSQDKKLGVIEKDLAFVAKSDKRGSQRCFEVWVMKEYNVMESWVKLFRIEEDVLRYSTDPPKLIKVCNSQLLLLWDGDFLISYNTVSGRFRRLWTEEDWGMFHVLPLVGSIISLKEAFNMDCKMKRTT